MPEITSQTNFDSRLDSLACDKTSAANRQNVLDCVLHMYAASTAKVLSLFEAGNSADLCMIEDLALDLAAIRRPRWRLRQQSDVDQTVAAATAALNDADRIHLPIFLTKT